MNNIAIHSVPRSGSSWLGSIFDSSPHVAYRFQPLFSYAHKGQLIPTSTQSEIQTFFNDILNTDDSFVLQEDAIDKGLKPNFKKENLSHIVYKEVRYHNILHNLLQSDNTIKIIGLVRNPFAVINSWLRAPQEFRAEFAWKIEEEWRFAAKKNLGLPEEFHGYEKWKEVTYLFLDLKKQFPNRFYLLNYSDLIRERKSIISKLFEFAELDITEQTVDFIDQSLEREVTDAYSVFKIKQDDLQWKKTLPQSISSVIHNDPEFIALNKIFKWKV